MNTRATWPFAHERGADTFCTIEGYQRRRAVERTVQREVRDIRNFVLKVEELGGGEPPLMVWQK